MNKSDGFRCPVPARWYWFVALTLSRGNILTLAEMLSKRESHDVLLELRVGARETVPITGAYGCRL